jgi:alpha-ribazole phosphatase
MSELWLVRHGQTDWNLAGRYQGQADVPLNETGLAQARALADSLTGTVFKALYCSDLARARQTAEILGERLGLAPRIDARLREIDQGEWEGLAFSEIVSHYANVMDARSQDPVNQRAPGGESVAEVAARVGEAAGDIARRHPQGPVLIVLHGLALATLTCQARYIPLANVYEHIPQNAAPEVISWPPQRQPELEGSMASRRGSDGDREVQP